MVLLIRSTRRYDPRKVNRCIEGGVDMKESGLCGIGFQWQPRVEGRTNEEVVVRPHHPLKPRKESSMVAKVHTWGIVRRR